MAAVSMPWRRFAGAVGGASIAIGAFMSYHGTTPARMQSIEPALSPKEARPFTIEKIEKISHNTNLFRFKLEPGQPLGMTVASCLTLEIDGPDGKPISKPYTPTTLPDTMGHFDLVIKKYDNGALTPHLFSMKAGDTVRMKGPWKKLDIVPNMKREIGMVAGGTGITPMYQCIQQLLKSPEDKTKITLVFANVSENDILLKKELDELAKKHPRFTIHYVLDKAPAGWKGFEGHVNRDILDKTMPKPGADTMVFICGPPPMYKVISGMKAPDFTQGEVDGIFKEMGYTKDMVYKF